MANDKLMTVILRRHEEERIRNLLEQVKQLAAPPGLTAQVFVVEDRDLSRTCNHVLRGLPGNAMYKVFISDEVERIDNPYLLVDLYKSLTRRFDIGLIGVLGSGLPLHGDLRGSDFLRYGRHDRTDAEDPLSASVNPFSMQRVAALDPAVFALRADADLEWDEEVGSVFAIQAQIARLEKRGKYAFVIRQDEPWFRYYGESIYEGRKDEVYERQRRSFCQRYPERAQPLVSVLMPTYNQPEYFRLALESALEQDYGNVEIIVGDDSTDDRTEILIQPYLERYGNIRYTHHDSSLGQHGLGNMRFCMGEARGEYVNFLFHDDLFYPGKLTRMVQAYREDVADELAFVTSVRDVVDENGRTVPYWRAYSPNKDVRLPGRSVGREILLNIHNCVGELTTMLFRRRDVLNFGHYFGLQDRSMWDISTALELCKDGRDCLYLSHPYSAFRHHGAQNTKSAAVVLTARLDWLALATMSYLHNAYFCTEREYWDTCALYVSSFVHIPLDALGDGGDGEEAGPEELRIYRKLMETAKSGDRDGFFHALIEYMLAYAETPECIRNVCRRERKNRMWKKAGTPLPDG